MAHRYPRVLDAVYSSPWSILPSKLAAILSFLHFADAGGNLTDEDIAAVVGVGRKPQGVQQAGRVGLIQIFGTISQRPDAFSSGGTSCEMIGQGLDALMADKTCKAILLQIDSPGGSVFGVGEIAKRIFDARGEKKIVAVADSLAASAAYWIGSQAEEFCIVPGGQAGSIGCITAHQDLSKAMEAEGVATTIVSAGKYKSEASPFAPLGEEAKEAMQATVDSYYDAFVKAVARGRGVSETKVRSGFGEGRCLTADACKSAGICDRIATLEQCLSRLGADMDSVAAAAWLPSTDALRRRQDLEEAG